MQKTGDCFTCSACGNWEPLVDEGTPEPRRFGHLGIAIVGGYIWPGWSRSREVFPIEPYEPSVVTGADIMRGQELAAELGW